MGVSTMVKGHRRQDTQRPTEIVLSCVHGGNLVPKDFHRMFAQHADLLKTHRGWDPGTRQLGEQWAGRTKIR